MKSFFFYILSGSVLFLQFSCKDLLKTKSKDNSSVFTSAHINDSNLAIYNGSGLALGSNPKQVDYTILSYVDVTCSVCIAEIDKWKDMYDSSKRNNFQIKLVFFAKDNFEYIKYLCETKIVKPFPFPFYLDTANNFSVKNPIFRNHAIDKTVLVNNDGLVIMVGNPLHADSTMAKYLNAME